MNAFFDHAACGKLGAVRRGIEVERNLLIPVIHEHIHKAALGHFQRTPGVVHQHINASEMVDKGIQHTFTLVAAADVALINLRVNTIAAAFLGDALRSLGRFVVVDAHVIAILGERDDGSSANAVGRASNQNRFSFAHLNSPFTCILSRNCVTV